MNTRDIFTDNHVGKLFGVKYPIIQAGMVWTSGAKLAVAVSNAGGLGIIGSGSMKPDLLRQQIRKAFSLTANPFGVNIPLLRGDSDDLVRVCLEEGIGIIFSSAGNPKKYTKTLKSEGCTVIHVVPAVKFGLKAQAAGCDAVVAEGFEAGGHNGLDMVTTMALIPQMVDALDIPVIAAGGIGDGRGMAAAFCLGAKGVQVGTRFAASQESSSHANYKKAVLESNDTSTILGLLKIGPARMIKNHFTEAVAKAESMGAAAEELRELLGSKRERLGIFEGDIVEGQVEAGQIAGLIKDIPSASDIVESMVQEYKNTLNRLKFQ
ncbi:nitronate monooxygenase [bacterium]|nr:nitronate monooxygenase [bacterium]